MKQLSRIIKTVTHTGKATRSTKQVRVTELRGLQIVETSHITKNNLTGRNKTFLELTIPEARQSKLQCRIGRYRGASITDLIMLKLNEEASQTNLSLLVCAFFADDQAAQAILCTSVSK
ncbi:Hypothetical_protein [Hexamita inflata]|uniref:Hypothetical_protein n=1 Tax=Hexamita inflata TaxID=28002 RepID=A0AA86R6L0_9EUKA|nr:Hypothetical protein HINF_LOCUS58017 [Hexamita inflata]